MSGHSKWATTRRHKAVVDAKRGAHFTKLSKAITVAAREGGGDPDRNMKLRLSVDLARSASMPKENIERAIKRGTGELVGDTVEELVYEGFGPEGVALLVEVMTDNRNRTVSDVKKVFTKYGCSMGAQGSVGWMFERKGAIRIIPTSDTMVDELVLIDLGVEDIISEDEELLLLTPPDKLTTIERGVQELGYTVEQSELVYWPKSPVAFPEDRAGEKLGQLVDTLDNLDDVVNVFTNTTS
ncbi:YebC/PmpR family DNA-binding transcriptional regulator [Candidatus Uhrbacteria bacterium CG10_big_fil_rev_8_21_14_0_10_48_11]|uniref:Probable transcriptional regulatory protein COV04_02285 n=1 Tax=Candidatus Uhrbacteria bacterium CG10_big_fil_rev_8_21_14_0_10_48_11 TaxID=1975037 RepID=A0A2M8LET3_9BACT|nr:MAG: YebC/PmpR family DNA-binding transcriptional regulator [Candidatus Uhrbacteria bacterium CG10_big_fil_rev_8_21_14_0_10_48_11]